MFFWGRNFGFVRAGRGFFPLAVVLDYALQIAHKRIGYFAQIVVAQDF